MLLDLGEDISDVAFPTFPLCLNRGSDISSLSSLFVGLSAYKFSVAGCRCNAKQTQLLHGSGVHGASVTWSCLNYVLDRHDALLFGEQHFSHFGIFKYNILKMPSDCEGSHLFLLSYMMEGIISLQILHGRLCGEFLLRTDGHFVMLMLASWSLYWWIVRMRFPSLSPRSGNLLIFSTDQTRYGELGEPAAKSSCLACRRT
ncbi:hypothetical protein Droror1_Dr00004100 [Drosera rotundifolia]